MQEEQDTGHGQQRRQPEALLQHGRHLGIAPRAVQIGHHWRHSLQDADQRENHRDMHAAPNGYRCQISGADMAEHGRIYDHHADRRQLGN